LELVDDRQPLAFADLGNESLIHRKIFKSPRRTMNLSRALAPLQAIPGGDAAGAFPPGAFVQSFRSVMLRFIFSFMLLLLAAAPCVRGQIAWEKTTLEFHPTVTDTEVS